MSELEQAQQLVDELNSVLNRFRAEYEISYATAIGCLEVVKMDLFSEASSDDD